MSSRTIRRGLVGLVVLGLVVGTAALAQTPPGRGPMPGMGPGSMGPGMMGHGPGMMGMGMGCPLMTPDADVKVEKRDDGVSISITSSDPKLASRIQKRAEIMRLVHELQREEP